ncbi:YbaB/EbfC family nucleoid-associated protein [Kribbella yunnanensis]
MGDLEQLEQEIRQTQETVAETTGSALAGDDLIEATVTGDGRLLRLVLDPRAYREFAPESLADEIVGVVNAARTKALEAAVDVLTVRLPRLGSPIGDDPTFGPLLAEAQRPVARRGTDPAR